MRFEELLETVPLEVKAAIEEIEHKAGTIDADWEFVKAAGELLAAAKAASVCPVGITDLVLCGGGQRIEFYIEGDKSDGLKMIAWLRDRMKERGE